MAAEAYVLSVICIHERQIHSVNGHSISEVAYSRFGSGRELPLSEFITVKPPLEFRFPEAALRH